MPSSLPVDDRSDGSEGFVLRHMAQVQSQQIDGPLEIAPRPGCIQDGRHMAAVHPAADLAIAPDKVQFVAVPEPHLDLLDPLATAADLNMVDAYGHGRHCRTMRVITSS